MKYILVIIILSNPPRVVLVPQESLETCLYTLDLVQYRFENKIQTYCDKAIEA